MSVPSGSSQPVPCFWFDEVPNFGDLMTPALLTRFGIPVVHSPLERCRVVATGSVLDGMDPGWTGVVLGSGFMNSQVRMGSHRAELLALRGKLTRDRIRGAGRVPLGDPGLLAGDLCAAPEETRVTLGLVPHYADRKHPAVTGLVGGEPDEVRLIDVCRPPEEVIREIATCSVVASSSLHGVIVADALGIPATWLLVTDRVLGAGFKFFDYASALGALRYPVALGPGARVKDLVAAASRPARERVEEVQCRLRDLFEALPERLAGIAEASSRRGHRPAPGP